MSTRTLNAILAGAITLFSATAASSQELRLSSYGSRIPLNAYPPSKPMTFDLSEPYNSRGGGLLNTLTEIYAASEVGKRRAEKLRLKREGLPNFEPRSEAMIPRKAGKAGIHINLGSSDRNFLLYTEAYAIKNYWTRKVRPGIQFQIKIKY